MTTGKALAVNVAVADELGRVHLWRRGETPPPQVADQLGAHVFVGGEHVLSKAGTKSPEAVRELIGAPAPREVVPDSDDDGLAQNRQPYVVGEAGPELVQPAAAGETSEDTDDAGDGTDAGEPPRSGAGATRAAWHAYAADLGQDVDDDAPRDAVIQQLIDAGLIQE